ncbi:hypothetical protein GM921_00725 [Pedobacter sp. LMG 31464]|uniref:HNH endonuclease n=1 Tax=Pedobacter planticolens TaxID=2679964 RepID=A0A923DXV0_9SPHI|nr:hypothetical protein [Pedobacter planticolens]MBB2143994.1 hypothetical protein [Pedobacter planticolens]
MTTEATKPRYEFSQNTKDKIKMAAAFICANPDCHLVTIGPSGSDENRIQYNGKVSHILPASVGGPRDREKVTPEERMAIENAIFLCSSCGDLIDKNNGIDYPESLLKKWKEDHHQWTKSNLNKPYNGKQTINIGAILNNSPVAVQNIYTGQVPEDKEIAHDLEIFKKLEEIADEPLLMLIWNSLKDYFRLMSSQQHKLDDVRDFFELSKNDFLNDNIQQAALNYKASLEKLDVILSYDFDKYPANQGTRDYRLELLPYSIHYTGRELNATDHAKFEKGAEKMRTIMPELIDNYRKFRLEIKRALAY